jgi:hypothetical protein
MVMNFNQHHERYVNNLDNAHDALLDSLEQELTETEMLEDEILSDTELFNRLAILFCRWDSGHGYPQKTFLDWAVERLRRERTPQWKRWED